MPSPEAGTGLGPGAGGYVSAPGYRGAARTGPPGTPPPPGPGTPAQWTPPRGAPGGTVPWWNQPGGPGSGWDGFFTGPGTRPTGRRGTPQQPATGAQLARALADVLLRTLRGGR